MRRANNMSGPDKSNTLRGTCATRTFCATTILLIYLNNVPFTGCEPVTTTDNYTDFTTDLPGSTDSNLVGVDSDPCTEIDVSERLDGVLCRTHDDCYAFSQYCCQLNNKRQCIKPKQKLNPATHQPLLGVLPRECPSEPTPEPLAVRSCASDSDCWPRICCPDGNSSYCRTPQPPWQKLPAQRLVEPLRNMMAYMQCTPPPPPLYDLFPKECRTTLDCFPNLCCQEQNRKVCRPPRKSLLALISTLGRT